MPKHNSILNLVVKLPKGVSAAKAKAAVRKSYGVTLSQAVSNLILDALPSA